MAYIEACICDGHVSKVDAEPPRPPMGMAAAAAAMAAVAAAA